MQSCELQIGGSCPVVVELARGESVTDGATSSSIIGWLLVTKTGRILNVEIYQGGDQLGKALKGNFEILSPLQLICF